jgi:hypothetical protein
MRYLLANISLIMLKESILLVSRWIKQLVQEDELRLIMQGVCGEENNHEKLSRSLASENSCKFKLLRLRPS